MCFKKRFVTGFEAELARKITRICYIRHLQAPASLRDTDEVTKENLVHSPT